MNDREEAEAIARQFIGSGSDVAGRIDRCANAVVAYGEQVRREQREVDAKICDAIATENSAGTFNDSHREVRAAESCAAAIRANDQETKRKGV